MLRSGITEQEGARSPAAAPWGSSTTAMQPTVAMSVGGMAVAASYVEVAGLPSGAHGIHLHTVGACEPDFKAATGHINPNGVV